MSTARTGLLMVTMTTLFILIGLLLGGPVGMAIAFLFAIGMNVYAYWNSDKMVLRMHGAQQVDKTTAPELVGLVEHLSHKANLPVPKVYIIDSPQPNAFATGRNPDNAAVAATTGLLRSLNRSEIEGVMAHELAHVKNRDTLTMTITATLAGAISMLAQFSMFFGDNRNNPLGFLGSILVMILAPLAAMMVQMAISRTREYEADKIGAEISGNPLALASALAKLQRSATTTDNIRAEENPATAHMFIVNPLKGSSIDSLFSTHPNMENRIAKLEEQARNMGMNSARTHYHSKPVQNKKATWASSIKSQKNTASRNHSQSSVPNAGKKAKSTHNKSPWG